MDMKPVADHLGRDFVGLQNCSCESGRAMVKRRHAIEQMRRLPRAGGDAGERLLEGRARVSEGYIVASRCEPSDQIEAAIKLGSDGHDADVWSRALDFAKDIVASEIAWPFVARPFHGRVRISRG